MAKPSSNRNKATSATSSDDTPADDQDLEENPATATITVTAVEVTELTEEEIRDRLLLERKVERAFFEAGKALMELRDRKLYRSTHKTFEEYCHDRFGHNRRQSYLLMDAAVIFDNLEQKCDRSDHILPTNEWQISPLTKLDPDIQPEASSRICQRESTFASARQRCCAAYNGANPSTQYLPDWRSLQQVTKLHTLISAVPLHAPLYTEQREAILQLLDKLRVAGLLKQVMPKTPTEIPSENLISPET